MTLEQYLDLGHYIAFSLSFYEIFEFSEKSHHFLSFKRSPLLLFTFNIAPLRAFQTGICQIGEGHPYEVWNE